MPVKIIALGNGNRRVGSKSVLKKFTLKKKQKTFWIKSKTETVAKTSELTLEEVLSTLLPFSFQEQRYQIEPTALKYPFQAELTPHTDSCKC